MNPKTLLFRLVRWLKRVLRAVQSQEIKLRLKACGRDVTLIAPLCIEGAEYVTFGDDVAVAPFVHMWGLGGITIGDRVMIGSHTAISSLTHDFNQESMQGTLIKGEVRIHDDVWIGGHVVIMPGITIGKGAVIGAGSIVTKDVEPYSIVAGVPARRLKWRAIKARDST